MRETRIVNKSTFIVILELFSVDSARVISTVAESLIPGIVGKCCSARLRFGCSSATLLKSSGGNTFEDTFDGVVEELDINEVRIKKMSRIHFGGKCGDERER